MNAHPVQTPGHTRTEHLALSGGRRSEASSLHRRIPATSRRHCFSNGSRRSARPSSPGGAVGPRFAPDARSGDYDQVANIQTVSIKNNARFDTPLYTVAEAARFLGVPPTSFGNWARGYRVTFRSREPVVGRPIVTSFEAARHYPSIPFIGLAEGFVVLAFRRAGVSLQHIRKAVAVLEREVGLEHALASQRLFADGASVLFDYAEDEQDEELLTHVVTQQRALADVVRDYLRLISYGSDGWPEKLVSPATTRPVVIVDPERAFGQPIFMRGGVRVEDVVDRWRAGESLAEVAEDFGVPPEDVEDILRVALPAAA